MKYPTFHLSFSWYTHFPEGSCVWYTTRKRFITSIYIDAGMQFGDAMKKKERLISVTESGEGSFGFFGILCQCT